MIDVEIASPTRKSILSIIVIGFCFVLLFQMIKMQLIDDLIYNEKSSENSIKEIYQQAPRGIVYDRNYNVLVNNRPSFSVQITPAFYNTKLNDKLDEHLAFETGTLSKILKQNQGYSKYIPRLIKRGVDFKFIAWYEENSDDLAGVNYITDSERDYSHGVKGAHMFGYIREISQEKLKQHKGQYRMGDMIGLTGIERGYEKYLRGEQGIKYILFDAQQRIIGRYNNGNDDKKIVKGNDLVLGIDLAAQKAAEDGFKGRQGSLVAIEPSTGEILAFVSSPDFDLEKLTSFTTNNDWAQLLSDPNKPLFNRATMSVNPPGSTFKMFEALVALQEGIITPDYHINCPGGFQFGNRFFKCHGAHGNVNIQQSIEKSCNTFYYQLILKIGIDKWAEYAHKFGFGLKTGIDIGEELPGLVPDRGYYDKAFGKNKWGNGFLVSLGIGQGELSTSIIQLAQYTAMLANYGVTYEPHFVKGFVDNKSQKFVPFEKKEIKVDIKREYFDIVREGMYLVVNGAGTATHIKQNGFVIAGKTGTSQNPHGSDHALFIGFAPYDNPKIAVAVIVHNVGFGGTHAAPIARDVMIAYLEKNKKVVKNESVKKDSLKGN
ncbi:MAG: penicillin-binding protein 2 [bacterium]